MKKIYIIHENDEWTSPLEEELTKLNATEDLNIASKKDDRSLFEEEVDGINTVGEEDKLQLESASDSKSSYKENEHDVGHIVGAEESLSTVFLALFRAEGALTFSATYGLKD